MSVTLGTKLARIKPETLSDGSRVYDVAVYDEEGKEAVIIGMDSRDSAEELLTLLGRHSSDVLSE